MLTPKWSLLINIEKKQRTERVLPEEISGEEVGIFHRWLLHPKCAASLVVCTWVRLLHVAHICVVLPPTCPPRKWICSHSYFFFFNTQLKSSSTYDVTFRLTSSPPPAKKQWFLSCRASFQWFRCLSLCLSAALRDSGGDSPSFMGSPKKKEKRNAGDACVISTLPSLLSRVVATRWGGEACWSERGHFQTGIDP